MEDLTYELAQGLPTGWSKSPLYTALPPQTTIAHCASDGIRKLAFLRVSGVMRSSIPYFEANSRLRNSGVEPIWLFDCGAIPSTKRMLCTSLEWLASTPVVSIVNVGQGGNEDRNLVELPTLAQAAADKRLKVAEIEVGQRVSVALTSDRTVCRECGAIDYRVDHATIRLVDNPSVPSLALSRNKLGACVSRLMLEGLVSQTKVQKHPSHEAGERCPSCNRQRYEYVDLPSTKQSAMGSIVLSSMAALELLRHYQTAWYIA
ncbi:hypothetical protein [Pseudomonas sp. MWU12-2323]|uniref:hypothetical protein n=1 Tax=Pseudomonas sp. MWU12-2323 TaxID=2651296 RepID=UPI00128BE8DE|nr:hypothetical protein [Pseudomonas sp. MWU12-2323]MPQ71527.1 hypothetical protein [Pseudomonas sp. MWU12-2323]